MAASSAAQLTSVLAAAALLIGVVACQKEVENPATASDLAALPLTVPAPASNPSSPAKIALGRALFWDPVLSGGKDVSCASCHHPAAGYADGLDLAIGENGQGLGPAISEPPTPFLSASATPRPCSMRPSMAWRPMAPWTRPRRPCSGTAAPRRWKRSR